MSWDLRVPGYRSVTQQMFVKVSCGPGTGSGSGPPQPEWRPECTWSVVPALVPMLERKQATRLASLLMEDSARAMARPFYRWTH